MNKTFEIAVNSTARKLWLAGDINMAAGDMLAAQRGVLLYANTQEDVDQHELFDIAIRADRPDAAELRSLSVDQRRIGDHRRL